MSRWVFFSLAPESDLALLHSRIRSRSSFGLSLGYRSGAPLSAMAPHLTGQELDFIHSRSALGKTPTEVHGLLAKQRARKGLATPDLTNLRKVIKGKTYKRGHTETRGRKLKLTKKWVDTLNAARKRLIKKTNNHREVRWQDVVKKARAPKAHRTTVKRAFTRYGIKVAARRPREKPQRTSEHMQERVEHCREWGCKPASYFTNKVDLIIDNKVFDLPTSERARQYLAHQRVRFHLRTPAEGLNKEFTKPGRKKNKFNTGGKVNVCAGISKGRVVLWEYLPKTWNGEQAASLYGGAIMDILKKQHGHKRSYRVLEDNDPRGFKSGKAQSAKAELGITACPFPRYSPDLNPLDFAIWDEVERRMIKNAPKKVETVAEYKKRLRLTALRLPSEFVSKAVCSIPKRMKAVVEAKGGNIKCD